MIVIRDRTTRGRTNPGWLDSRHSFSFGGDRDPDNIGFRALRVLNDDRVIPGGGFATHSHRDMEIVSYVLSGALEHRDSMGNGSVIRPGDVQRMSAGTGVQHSEFNASEQEKLHLLQIWLVPQHEEVDPTYAEKHFPVDEKRGQLRAIASPRAWPRPPRPLRRDSSRGPP